MPSTLAVTVLCFSAPNYSGDYITSILKAQFLLYISVSPTVAVTLLYFSASTCSGDFTVLYISAPNCSGDCNVFQCLQLLRWLYCISVPPTVAVTVPYFSAPNCSGDCILYFSAANCSGDSWGCGAEPDSGAEAGGSLRGWGIPASARLMGQTGEGPPMICWIPTPSFLSSLFLYPSHFSTSPFTTELSVYVHYPFLPLFFSVRYCGIVLWV